MLSKNLIKQKQDQFFAIKLFIDTRFKDATNNSYLLSMPLLASALLGDDHKYREILSKIEHANFEEKYKAWLFGRVLLAADTMNDEITAKKAKTIIKDEAQKGINTPFMAWALGYLAAVDPTEYQIHKKELLTYCDAALSAKSDAIWSCIMLLQASAFNKDEEIFKKMVLKINDIAGYSELSDSLRKGLTRAEGSSDFPAWAIGIAALAAASIGYQDLYKDLIESSVISCIEAKIDFIDEFYLGQLTADLARVRHDEMLGPEVSRSLT